MAVGLTTKTLLVPFLFSSVAVLTFLDQCDARSPRHLSPTQQHRRRASRPWRSTQHTMGSLKKLQPVKHLAIYSSSDPYYVGSPFSLPPYEDVMGGSPSPSSSPQPGDPIYCVNPPPVPQQPPSTGLPPPVIYPPESPSSPPPSSPPVYSSPPVFVPAPPEYTPTPNPTPEQPPIPPSYEPSPPEYVPPSPVVILPSPVGVVPSPPEYVTPSPVVILPSPVGVVPSPPEYVPSPPPYTIPNPPIYVPSPPGYAVPSPPEYYLPSPPGSYVPGPPGYYVPSPPVYVFQPPVVYPPPNAPPPPASGVTNGLWCVAKPAVPDPIIQEAMNYACGSGADCDSIQPNGSCYQPDTLMNHASYAFNSYFQRTRAAGGTCDFGGTAMLVTKDPSVDGCHFITISLQGIDGGE